MIFFSLPLTVTVCLHQRQLQKIKIIAGDTEKKIGKHIGKMMPKEKKPNV